ncbi:MAG: alpha-aminoadipate/glutamate carrier protein LysW [Nitrososphaeraceae archaeon]
MITECKDCAGEIKLPQDAMIGEIITCADCGADFEIASKSEDTVEIKPAESIGEDWGE